MQGGGKKIARVEWSKGALEGEVRGRWGGGGGGCWSTARPG